MAIVHRKMRSGRKPETSKSMMENTGLDGGRGSVGVVEVEKEDPRRDLGENGRLGGIYQPE